jgi:hypothetical protein|tara:strand:- start:1367 stop:2083 length:717 start_codon:yes stop_codon:yes gene_type:complete
MAVHFTGPILFAGKDGTKKWFENLPIDRNPDYVAYMDDFDRIGFDSNTGHRWTVVKDSGASVAIVADTVNGEVALTSAGTTDNDGASIQKNEIFAVQSSKDLWFETKAKLSDADQMDFCAGFTVNFATNPEAMLAAADRICFQVDDGDASILCKTEKDGTETSTDSGIDFADATYRTLSIRVQSTGKVDFFIDRSLVATHTANIPDDENLTIAAMSVSGDASGTKATTLDYMFAASDR